MLTAATKMDLVSLFRKARQATRAMLSPVCGAALVVVSSQAPGQSRTIVLASIGLVTLISVVTRSIARVQVRRDDHAVPPLDGAVALVILSLAYVIVNLTGGLLSSPLNALPLLVLAVTSSLAHPRAAVASALFAVGVEAMLSLPDLARHTGSVLSISSEGTRHFVIRAVLVVVAGVLHQMLTRGEIKRMRVHTERMLEDERRRQKEAARSFRLVGSGGHAPRKSAVTDDSRVRSSLDEIRETLLGTLDLARKTLRLKTCAVFWMDARGENLRMVDAVSDDTNALCVTPIAMGAGAVGGSAAMGRPLVLSKLRSDYAGLSYYNGQHEIKAFAALPLIDEGNVRGVLVADRAEDRPFDTDDQSALEVAAKQALRHVNNERVFGMLEKTRDELARLFSASRALGEALTEDQVIAAMVMAARTIVEHDLSVVASYDERSREHRVRHMHDHREPTDRDQGVKGLTQGHLFSDNSGIASAAIKTRHALPYKGQFDSRTQYLFSRNGTVDGFESLLCLPLVVRDHAIGTLTLAARRRAAFPEGARQLLGVLAAHAAVAMANAAAVRRLEELATTDPMTGLLNKRAMETEFERKIRSAERFGKPLAVVVTDIDKFKNVNDTYGHSTGDVVIKALGAVLARCKRDTDIVARFGGEEFVLVCEETDTEGARLLAERIRTELAAKVFTTEIGPLSVTCSLGVAEFPRDGATREELFSRADEALYEAKRGGRNQTRTCSKRAAPVSAQQSTRTTRATTEAKRPSKAG